MYSLQSTVGSLQCRHPQLPSSCHVFRILAGMQMVWKYWSTGRINKRGGGAGGSTAHPGKRGQLSQNPVTEERSQFSRRCLCPSREHEARPGYTRTWARTSPAPPKKTKQNKKKSIIQQCRILRNLIMIIIKKNGTIQNRIENGSI